MQPPIEGYLPTRPGKLIANTGIFEQQEHCGADAARKTKLKVMPSDVETYDHRESISNKAQEERDRWPCD